MYTCDGDVDNGDIVCVRAGYVKEISVPSVQFCCKPKTAQKIVY